ncbi:MAG: tetratricopeptide repeat protein [Terriglobales bacterium]
MHCSNLRILPVLLAAACVATLAAQSGNAAARRDRDAFNLPALETLAARAAQQATSAKTGAAYLHSAQLYAWASEAALGRQDKPAIVQLTKAGMNAAQAAVKLEPRSAAAHAFLGSFMGQMIPYVPNGGMIYGERATQELATALRIDPHSVQALTAQGLALLYTPAAFGGGPAAALKDLQKAAALGPRDDTPHLWLAQVYEQQKNWSGAKREIATALKLDPHRQFSRYVAARIAKESAGR